MDQKITKFFLGNNKGKKIAVIRTFALLVLPMFCSNVLWFVLFKSDYRIMGIASLTVGLYCTGLLLAEMNEFKFSAIIRLLSCLFFYIYCFDKAGGVSSVGVVWTSSIVLGIMWASGYRMSSLLSFSSPVSPYAGPWIQKITLRSVSSFLIFA